eukprot:7691964-Heterocapsa_arctica.AAC.1
MFACSHLCQRSESFPHFDALPPFMMRLASFTTPKQSATMEMLPEKCSATKRWHVAPPGTPFGLSPGAVGR